MNDTNTMANISLGSAIGLIVLFFVSFCLGMIPFVGMLNLLIYPLEWLLVFVAIGTGTMGLIQASKLDGVGRPQALMGVSIPILWVLFQVVVITVGIGLLGFLAVMENM